MTVHELLWILLDIGIGSRWFHVSIVILTRTIHEELLGIVIPLRSSHASSFDKQVVPAR